METAVKKEETFSFHKAILDFFIITTGCAIFLIYKEIWFTGFVKYSGGWAELTAAVLPVIVFASLFTYIPFLVGYRIKKSAADLAVLSSISALLFFLFSSILGVIIFRDSAYYEVLAFSKIHTYYAS